MTVSSQAGLGGQEVEVTAGTSSPKSILAVNSRAGPEVVVKRANR
jgi:hypothetical protein